MGEARPSEIREPERSRDERPPDRLAARRVELEMRWIVSIARRPSRGGLGVEARVQEVEHEPPRLDLFVGAEGWLGRGSSDRRLLGARAIVIAVDDALGAENALDDEAAQAEEEREAFALEVRYRVAPLGARTGGRLCADPRSRCMCMGMCRALQVERPRVTRVE